MPIATETVYWSDSVGARNMKLVRAARAQRMAAIGDPAVYILMIGMFPKSTASDFANRAKRRYVDFMREGRDTLVSCGVWENAIDGYIPFQEAPIDQFVYTVTVDTGRRRNPFPALDSMSIDEAPGGDAGGGDGDKEPLVTRKFVIDPFDDDGVAMKAQIEVDIVEATGRRLNPPGEFTATLEFDHAGVKEVGVEWTALKKRLAGRIARGAIRNIEIKITAAGKTDLGAADARRIFGKWSAEAQASLSAELHVGRAKVTLEIGVKAGPGEGPGPVLQIVF